MKMLWKLTKEASRYKGLYVVGETWNQVTKAQIGSVATRHGGGANFVYFDGHVETFMTRCSIAPNTYTDTLNPYALGLPVYSKDKNFWAGL